MLALWPEIDCGQPRTTWSRPPCRGDTVARVHSLAKVRKATTRKTRYLHRVLICSEDAVEDKWNIWCGLGFGWRGNGNGLEFLEDHRRLEKG